MLFDVTDTAAAAKAADAPPQPTRHVELSRRVGTSLAILGDALRGRQAGGAGGVETLGFLVGSAPHRRVIAALDELEAVRRALLEEEGGAHVEAPTS